MRSAPPRVAARKISSLALLIRVTSIVLEGLASTDENVVTPEPTMLAAGQPREPLAIRSESLRSQRAGTPVSIVAPCGQRGDHPLHGERLGRRVAGVAVVDAYPQARAGAGALLAELRPSRSGAGRSGRLRARPSRPGAGATAGAGGGGDHRRDATRPRAYRCVSAPGRTGGRPARSETTRSPPGTARRHGPSPSIGNAREVQQDGHQLVRVLERVGRAAVGPTGAARELGVAAILDLDDVVERGHRPIVSPAKWLRPSTTAS